MPYTVGPLLLVQGAQGVIDLTRSNDLPNEIKLANRSPFLLHVLIGSDSYWLEPFAFAVYPARGSRSLSYSVEMTGPMAIAISPARQSSQWNTGQLELTIANVPECIAGATEGGLSIIDRTSAWSPVIGTGAKTGPVGANVIVAHCEIGDFNPPAWAGPGGDPLYRYGMVDLYCQIGFGAVGGPGDNLQVFQSGPVGSSSTVLPGGASLLGPGGANSAGPVVRIPRISIDRQDANTQASFSIQTFAADATGAVYKASIMAEMVG